MKEYSTGITLFSSLIVHLLAAWGLVWLVGDYYTATYWEGVVAVFVVRAMFASSGSTWTTK